MRAFRLAYDGRPFYGFQRQPTVPTVEGVLFDGFRELGVFGSDERKPPGYAAAGRTDRGVSAVAQTVGVESPEWLTPRALNGVLPGTVRAWAHADTGGFHATHDAVAREYTYHLHAPKVDVERARAALRRLSGGHDFHNLTPDERNTVRTLSTELERDGDFLVVTLRAGGFSRQLVRRAVTLVGSVATGDASLPKIDRVLSTEELSGAEGIAPAPAAPLVLTGVSYPDLDFHIDEEAAASARDVFEETRIAAATRARVAGDIGTRLR
ncbi:tRNA pseudouridine(38-40) synthase TruA [Halococcus sediminicola]|uniref:tRNA pseudouridine(38-40) synthase TruA n=1 Tax=Halococcus sediminicola TaxID=1264579 RepID=UPI00067927BA|nr:tRNA pseudouridine(38-40) synthase TruA [Halococcus sediminicola]